MNAYIERMEERVKYYKARIALAKKVIKDYDTGKYSIRKLAEKYDVNAGIIQDIIYNKNA